MTPAPLAPAAGHVRELRVLPRCNFCRQTASWDGPTVFGAWAYMCDAHEASLHLYPQETGVGVGQQLLLATPALLRPLRGQIEDALDEAAEAAQRAHAQDTTTLRFKAALEELPLTLEAQLAAIPVVKKPRRKPRKSTQVDSTAAKKPPRKKSTGVDIQG